MTLTALACIAALVAGAFACGQWARARHLARLVAYYRARVDAEPDGDHGGDHRAGRRRSA